MTDKKLEPKCGIGCEPWARGKESAGACAEQSHYDPETNSLVFALTAPCPCRACHGEPVVSVPVAHVHEAIRGGVVEGEIKCERPDCLPAPALGGMTGDIKEMRRGLHAMFLMVPEWVAQDFAAKMEAALAQARAEGVGIGIEYIRWMAGHEPSSKEKLAHYVKHAIERAKEEA